MSKEIKSGESKVHIDEETQAVVNWLRKHHLQACWLFVNHSTDARFEIKRNGVAVLSKKIFRSDKRNNLTYAEMKSMIIEMYKELKEKENEENE